jgi:hypothetical protein
MIELGGPAVTPGAIVLGLCLVAATTWALRRSDAVVVLAVSIAAIHAVAHTTEYLDAARVAGVRTTAVDVLLSAFLAVAGALDTTFAAVRRAPNRRRRCENGSVRIGERTDGRSRPYGVDSRDLISRS